MQCNILLMQNINIVLKHQLTTHAVNMLVHRVPRTHLLNGLPRNQYHQNGDHSWLTITTKLINPVITPGSQTEPSLWLPQQRPFHSLNDLITNQCHGVSLVCKINLFMLTHGVTYLRAVSVTENATIDRLINTL